MLPLIIIATLCVLMVFSMLKRKTNTLMVFLSVCLGAVLATYIAADFADVITAITRGNMLATTQWMQILLVGLPFVLAIVFTKGVGTPGGGIMALIFSLAATALAVFLVVGYLPSELRVSMQDTIVWQEINNSLTFILIAAGVITLLSLRSKRNESGKSSKH